MVFGLAGLGRLSIVAGPLLTSAGLVVGANAVRGSCRSRAQARQILCDCPRLAIGGMRDLSACGTNGP